MSITDTFARARAELGLAAESDPAAIKRAYRAALLAHPPDTDPDAFRRVRDAYELLKDPGAHASELLDAPLPHAPPPVASASTVTKPGATAVALLRLAVMSADVTTWSEPRAKKTETEKDETP